VPTKRKIIRVKITEDDIRRGKHYSGRTCPLALALSRKFGVRYSVYEFAATNFGSKGKQFSLCDSAAKFVRMFDNGEIVAPTTVCLKEHSSND